MRCKYPNCSKPVTKTWALVPLCNGHHEIIRLETGKHGGTGYYGNKKFNGAKVTSDADRVHYNKIAHMIPWSKDRLAAKKRVVTK